MDGFTIVHALPRTCRDNALKHNAALIISKIAEFKIVKQLTDLVIVELWGDRIGAPIFAASCYLHSGEGVDNNLALLAEISLSISDFRAGNPDGRVIVMGDFNMDLQQ